MVHFGHEGLRWVGGEKRPLGEWLKAAAAALESACGGRRRRCRRSLARRHGPVLIDCQGRTNDFSVWGGPWGRLQRPVVTGMWAVATQATLQTGPASVGRPAAWMNAPSAAILRGSSPTFKCPSSHLRVTRRQTSTEVGGGAADGGSAGASAGELSCGPM